MDMTPGHKQWKKFTLTGDALSAAWWPCPLFIWNNSIYLGLNLCILIWITPPGLNVTNAIPPFIYSVGPGNLFKLSDPNVFFVLFFVVDSFRSPCHLCCSYSPPFPMSLVFQIPPHHSPCCLCFVLSQSFDFKMGRKRMCPDSDKKRKKTSPKRHTDEQKKDRGDSAHANTRIGLFTAEQMKACIDEIKEVEQKAKDEGNKPKFSRNQLCAKHGISPSSVSKRMTGKVKGYGPQLGGARRGKILSQGMFKRHRGLLQ